MRCFITGVAGFVGSHLAERLLVEGHEVCGIDAFIDYYPRSFKERNLEKVRSWERFTLVEADLLDVYLPPLLEGIDWIFHQAAQAGVRPSWDEKFMLYVKCNVLATQRLLEAAVQMKGLQRFIYASSSSVYGDVHTFPIAESVRLNPFSPYGVTKLAAEHLCSLYQRNLGVPTVSLRYFTVYGPRQRPDMAFHRFCKAIVEQRPIQVYGDGGQTRDFTYVSDVVEANIRAATAESAVGEVLNIAGGSRVQLREVIQILRDISGVSVPIEYGLSQRGDVRDTFADTQLAARILGYSPLVPLKEGLAQEFEDIQALYTDAASLRLIAS